MVTAFYNRPDLPLHRHVSLCGRRFSAAVHLTRGGNASLGEVLRNHIMRPIDWLQIDLFVATPTLVTKPIDMYFKQGLDAKAGRGLLFKPLEQITYRFMGAERRAQTELGTGFYRLVSNKLTAVSARKFGRK